MWNDLKEGFWEVFMNLVMIAYLGVIIGIILYVFG